MREGNKLSLRVKGKRIIINYTYKVDGDYNNLKQKLQIVNQLYTF